MHAWLETSLVQPALQEDCWSQVRITVTVLRFGLHPCFSCGYKSFWSVIQLWECYVGSGDLSANSGGFTVSGNCVLGMAAQLIKTMTVS